MPDPLACELPGIYVQPDTGLVSVLDHVDATLEHDADKRPTLRITNPTKFHASVKIFSETSEQARTTLLSPVSMESAPRAEVPPGATTLFTIPH
jgi:hypothetical protein